MKQILNKKHFKGFTLVELIIVITILAILGTIAYISFQGYTKDARDSSRMSDIKQLYNGISIYKTQTEKTPIPDSYVNILSGTTTISYQGYAGTSVLRLLKITGGKDPGTKDYYIYSTDVNQKKGQLMTFMETADKDVQLLGRLKDLKEELTQVKLIDQAQATNTGYYQDKKIYVYGDKIGILTDSNKVPLQETTTATGVNLLTTTTPLTTYFGGTSYGEGKTTSTGITLINQINGAINGNSGNQYTVNGTITNGSGGTINLCGTSTDINSSGNFTLSNINYGTNCGNISVIRSGYSCSISVDGPISLTSNISNITGSCTPSNCLSSTQVVNMHTYNVPSFNHSTTTTQTGAVSITNGTRVFGQTFSCSYGVVSTSGGESNTSNTCDSGYTWDGTSCNFTPLSCIGCTVTFQNGTSRQMTYPGYSVFSQGGAHCSVWDAASGGGCAGGNLPGGAEFCQVKYVGGAWRYSCGCNGGTVYGHVPTSSSTTVSNITCNWGQSITLVNGLSGKVGDNTTFGQGRNN